MLSGQRVFGWGIILREKEGRKKIPMLPLISPEHLFQSSWRFLQLQTRLSLAHYHPKVQALFANGHRHLHPEDL
jgi:hypothetical protein